MRVIIEAVSILKPIPEEPLADPEIVPVLVRVVMDDLLKSIPVAVSPEKPEMVPLLVSVVILEVVFKLKPRPSRSSIDPKIVPVLLSVMMVDDINDIPTAVSLVADPEIVPLLLSVVMVDNVSILIPVPFEFLPSTKPVIKPLLVSVLMDDVYPITKPIP